MNNIKQKILQENNSDTLKAMDKYAKYIAVKW